ncbi:MAG: ferrous iron transport protein A [Thermoplasmata archaeon]|nr:MAG: ferrous iron transport protein A [Thermoplasmata archaeon]
MVDKMERQGIPLVDIPPGQKARIIHIVGGVGFKHRLNIMGIIEGKIIKIITRQPFRGPITIKVNGTSMTIGRGMAQKILVEVVK